jgi:DNA-binding NarL/FixJ family response regulator
MSRTDPPRTQTTPQEVRRRNLSGSGNAGDARRFGGEPKTVRNHAFHIITKLHVTDRSGAIHRARDVGLGGTSVGLNYPADLVSRSSSAIIE